MKKMFFISFCICLFFYSCKKHDCTEFPEKPENISPIDFNNYNNVYTVYWNYYGFCDEIDRSLKDREFVFNRNNFLCGPNPPGDNIKVWGWLRGYSLPNTGHFSIYGLKSGDFIRGRRLYVYLTAYDGNQLALKMDTINFPAKCFINGEVILPCLAESSLCRKTVTVSLYVNDINNIYFE